MRYDKPYLTYDKQADLLISRNLQADRGSLVRVLEQVGYYRFSGYLYPYRQDDGTYRVGTDLEEIWQIYTFERQFRLLVFDAIERIEVWFRSELVHELARLEGPFGYMDPAGLPRLSTNQYQRFIHRCESAYLHSKEPFVQHFSETYGDSHRLPPYWMLANLVDFGMVLTLYRGAPVEIRNKVSGKLAVSNKVAESWLMTLNSVRNCCAHHGRLWNKTLGIKPMIPKRDLKWHTPYEVDNKKIFGALTILSYLLKIVAPNSSWGIRLLALMEERLPHAHCGAMGFKPGWEHSPLWATWLSGKPEQDAGQVAPQSEE